MNHVKRHSVKKQYSCLLCSAYSHNEQSKVFILLSTSLWLNWLFRSECTWRTSTRTRHRIQSIITARSCRELGTCSWRSAFPPMLIRSMLPPWVKIYRLLFSLFLRTAIIFSTHAYLHYARIVKEPRYFLTVIILFCSLMAVKIVLNFLGLLF